MAFENFDEKARSWDDNPVRKERAVKVAELIKEQVPLSKDMTGLEYGCGTGLLGFELLPSVGRLDLTDKSEGMLEVVREKIAHYGVENASAIRLDLEHEQPAAGTYDLIFTLMALHHVENIPTVIERMARMLRPEGYLCIADLDTEDGSFHGGDFHGHHGFDRGWMSGLFGENGITLTHDSTAYVIRRDTESGPRDFSVFLLTGRKES